jgi:hypothetical protein
VTLFVALTPVWSSDIGRPKVSFYVQLMANTLGLCLRMSPVSANMSISFNFTASMNDGLSLVIQK